MTDLAARAAALLGETSAGGETIHAGGLSRVVRVRLGRRAVIAKDGPDPRAEAAMLAAILAAEAPAPRVLAVDDGVLVLEELADDGGLGRAWDSLGAAARRLHAAEGSAYGWDRDFRFAAVPIRNGWHASWPAFWGERRLVATLDGVPADLARRVERLAATLGARLPGRPRASLLHGDLWSGNVLAAGGRVTGLIDPACAYGDAEADLAMLCLFGAPGPEFWSAYGPLAPGAEARRPIYQLWPALVHLRLFGGGYRGMVGRLLAAAGA